MSVSAGAMPMTGHGLVLHLVPALFDARDGIVGGAERYVLELARHMAERVPTRLVTFGRRERTERVGDDHVDVMVAVDPGQHVRGVGEDIEPGDVVVEAGSVLTPPRVGVLAEIGLRVVAAYPRPRVGVLSTGDELVDGATPLQPGQIRDSNRPALLALVAQAGGEPVDLGHAADDRDAPRYRFELEEPISVAGLLARLEIDPRRVAIEPARHVSAIGHSMGGLVLRYALAHFALPPIKRAVQIAPPNQGSAMARYSIWPRIGRLLYGWKKNRGSCSCRLILRPLSN